MNDIKIVHNSHDTNYRNPFGAVNVGETVKLKLETNKKCNPHIVFINFFNNQVEMQMTECKEDGIIEKYCYELKLDTTDMLGTIFYYFRIECEGRVFLYGNNIENLGGVGQIYDNYPKCYQITVYHQSEVPKWYKEGIIYQIFVDRFFNGNKFGKVLNPKKNSFIYGNWTDTPMYIRNSDGGVTRWDFYGGNLLGVRKKLKYLKSLGVSIIYFNPIFESPSCHKYDTSDYEKIDPMFGTNEEFEELCSEAEALGIKIILDGVFSHTGSDSRYFNMYNNYKEIGAYQSLKSPYYRWYRFSDYPNLYDCWWGFGNMPNVDELNPSYLEYIISSKNSIVKRWIRAGASGWRLDVADELPDEFIKLLKQSIREEKSDTVLIGEVWEDASNKISYSKKREYLFGYELDSITNYPLRQLIIEYSKKQISSEYFIKRYKSLLENYPRENFFSTMNMLGTHDTERILTILEGKIEQLKIAVLLQMTLPGVPLIYYGDEAGVKGGKDPDNRKPYPWGKENIEVINIYKNLCRLRANENILKNGDIKFRNNFGNVLCFQRSNEEGVIIVIINSSDKEEKYILNNINGNAKNLIDDKETYESIKGTLNVILKGNQCKILKVQ